jgi:putative hydrolase of the HAD superfamily
MARLLFGRPEVQSEAPGGVPDWHELETGRLSLDEFHARLLERSPAYLGATLDLRAYREGLEVAISGIHWMMVHRIRELRQDGYRIGLLTNNVSEWGVIWRSSIPVEELFDVVVDSSAVGLRKPDQAIFHLACDRLRVSPDRAVFLDDSRAHVAAASSLGIRSILVDAGPLQALAELDELLSRLPRSSAGAAPADVLGEPFDDEV